MKKKYISLLFFTIVFGFYGIQVIFFNPFKCFDREMVHNLTTISTELGFLGKFVRLLLKTCSLYHEKLFIQVVNDISSQVFNNFFSASDIIEAVRGHFCVWYEGCVIQVILLRNKWVGIGIAYEGGGAHTPQVWLITV